jgi:hypothetical protein
VISRRQKKLRGERGGWHALNECAEANCLGGWRTLDALRGLGGLPLRVKVLQGWDIPRFLSPGALPWKPPPRNSFKILVLTRYHLTSGKYVIYWVVFALTNPRPNRSFLSIKRIHTLFTRKVAPLFSTSSNIAICKSFCLISIHTTPWGYEQFVPLLDAANRVASRFLCKSPFYFQQVANCFFC